MCLLHLGRMQIMPRLRWSRSRSRSFGPVGRRLDDVRGIRRIRDENQAGHFDGFNQSGNGSLRGGKGG